MTVKFSICRILFSRFDLKEFLKIAHELSFDGVEIGVKDVMTYFSSIDLYKKTLEDYGLKHSGSYWSAKFYDKQLHDKIIEESKEVLNFLSKVESDRLIIGPPARFEGFIPDKHLRIMAEILNKIGKIALDYGIKIGIHNHYGTIVESSNEIDLIMNLTNPDYVGFAPDTAHLGVSGCNVVESMRKYLDRIVYVHLKDVIRPGEFVPRTEKWTDRLRDLGQGEIDFVTIAKMLKSVNYKGWLAYEQDISPNPLESAKKSKEYIDKVLKPIFAK